MRAWHLWEEMPFFKRWIHFGGLVVGTVMFPMAKRATSMACAFLPALAGSGAGLMNQRKDTSFSQVCKHRRQGLGVLGKASRGPFI
jgi:hypothetical protein